MVRIVVLFIAASFASACRDDGSPGDASISLADAAVLVDGALPVQDGSMAALDAAIDAAFVPKFGCSADPEPSSAPPTLTISGTVVTVDAIGGKTPVESATVAASLSTGGSPVDTTTTSSAGAFTVTIPTGSVPIRVYLHASHAGQVDSILAPPRVFSANATLDQAIVLYSSAQLSAYATALGSTVDPTKAQLVGVVSDCVLAPIPGAVFSTTSVGGAVHYFAGISPVSSATATDATGVAIGLNLDPGDLSVGGTWNATQLHAHPVKLVAGLVTLTQLRP